MMDNKTLTISREINAPRARVWQAWTDQAEIKQWWGPRGVTNPTCVWEAKPGGRINITMLAGQELGPLAGQEWPMSGRFQQVEPESKLVFTSSALRDGQAILENHVTVTLEAQGDKTKMTVEIKVTKATPEAEGPLQGMGTGWNQQLDKLAQKLG